MSKKLKEKQIVVKSRTENLSKIRDFISAAAAKAGFNNESVENIMLAVDEACTNIIKHAYKSFPDGDIIIELSSSNSKFKILITDYGTSFEPDLIPTPNVQKYYREHRVGGLGMYLMKTLMDSVEYKSVPGKYNQVSLIKILKPS